MADCNYCTLRYVCSGFEDCPHRSSWDEFEEWLDLSIKLLSNKIYKYPDVREYKGGRAALLKVKSFLSREEDDRKK